MRRLLLSLALLLTIGAGCASAAPAPVQHKVDTGLRSSPTTLAFTSSVTSGNVALVFFFYGGTSTFTIAKSAGTSTIGTVTQATGIHDATNGQSMGFACIPITGSGTLTIQGTGGSASAEQLGISEWSGLSTSSPCGDVFGGQATSGTTPSSGAIVTTVDGDLVIAAANDDSGTATLTGPGAGFTQLDASGGVNLMEVQYQIQPTQGSISTTWTVSANQGSVNAIASLKPAAGGGGCTAPPNQLLMLGVGNCKGH